MRTLALASFATALLGLAFAACSPAASEAPLPVVPAASASAPIATPAPVPLDSGPRPPVATRSAHTTTVHGQSFVDDYYWLRNKGTPEVEADLNAENAYTDAMAKPFEPLAASLYDEMLARAQQDDASPPYKEGASLYYSRVEKGKQYPIHC